MILILWFPRWWPAWSAWFLAIAMSRVPAGAHYPSDVVAGLWARPSLHAVAGALAGGAQCRLHAAARPSAAGLRHARAWYLTPRKS
jgi:hypothetical protein